MLKCVFLSRYSEWLDVECDATLRFLVRMLGLGLIVGAHTQNLPQFPEQQSFVLPFLTATLGYLHD